MKPNMLQRLLVPLYCASGFLAALSMVAMMLLVVAQIIARQLDLHIPSSGDMIGFLVVWTSFLGLSYSMHYLHHIRVELILGHLNRKQKKTLNSLVGLLATIMLTIFTYYVIALITESYEFDDVTDGEIALPLWLMQLPMGIGCVLFTLSMLDFTLMQFNQKPSTIIAVEQTEKMNP